MSKQATEWYIFFFFKVAFQKFVVWWFFQVFTVSADGSSLGDLSKEVFSSLVKFLPLTPHKYSRPTTQYNDIRWSQRSQWINSCHTDLFKYRQGVIHLSTSYRRNKSFEMSTTSSLLNLYRHSHEKLVGAKRQKNKALWLCTEHVLNMSTGTTG